MMKKIKVLLMTVLTVSMLFSISMTAYAAEMPALTISGPATVEYSERVVITAQVTDWGGVEPAAGTARIDFPNGEKDTIAVEQSGRMTYTPVDAKIGDVYKIEMRKVNDSRVTSNILEVTICEPKKPEEKPEEKKVVEEESAPQFSEDEYVPNVVAKDKNQFGKDNESVVPVGAYNMSAYSTPTGFNKGVEKMADKKDADGNLYVYSGKPLTINRGLINTLKSKNATLTYYFVHNGHLYCIVIPPTTNPDLVIGTKSSEGPLTVGTLLGTARLIK